MSMLRQNQPQIEKADIEIKFQNINMKEKREKLLKRQEKMKKIVFAAFCI